MKLSKFAIASLLLAFYSCSNNNQETFIDDSLEEHIKISGQDDNQIIPDDTITIESWLETTSKTDSNWYVLTEFNETLDETKFSWYKLSRKFIDKSKNEYKKTKSETIIARDLIEDDRRNFHMEWGEGWLEQAWISEPLDTNSILENIQWVKLKSTEQYANLNWSGWMSYGEFSLQFKMVTESMKDCLTVALSPYGMSQYGDFDKDYRGRSLPFFEEDSTFNTDTLWTYQDGISYSLEGSEKGWPTYPLLNFMQYNADYPKWKIDDYYLKSKQNKLTTRYKDLANQRGNHDILQKLENLHQLERQLQPVREEVASLQEEIASLQIENENTNTSTLEGMEGFLKQDKLEIKKLLLEIKIQTEDGNPYTDPAHDIDRVEAMKRLANRLENRILEEKIKTQPTTTNSNLSAACQCAKVLASPNQYPRDIRVKCLRMYKCWNNANIDCMMGTETVWYECVP